MKASERIEQLLKVFYQIYQRDGTVRQYGLYPWNLTDKSGIRFTDAGDALATVNRMKAREWLKTEYKGRVKSYHRIQLTEQGIQYAEELLKPTLVRHLRGAYVATIEGITRAFRK